MWSLYYREYIVGFILGFNNRSNIVYLNKCNDKRTKAFKTMFKLVKDFLNIKNNKSKKS